MDCFVGSSTGALKGVMFRDGTFKNMNAVNTLKPKSDEITSMCWTAQDQTELLTAQMDRHLKLYDSINNTYTSLFKLDGGNGAVRGIHATNNGSIVSAVESGELRVWKNNGEMVSELNAGSNLLVMVGNNTIEGQYATGGNENPLKVWDVHVGQKTFTAKNVRPDNLQLRVPIWDTDIRFIPDSQNIVTTTGKYQIRIYDPRAQRRPVKEMEWLEEPLTAMSLCHSPMHIVAGNTRGEMGLFDLRNKRCSAYHRGGCGSFSNEQRNAMWPRDSLGAEQNKDSSAIFDVGQPVANATGREDSVHLVCKLKGFTGSVRGIDAHPSAPYVASCSIDRFVRLHDITTKKLVKKVYCKARLNKILLRNDLSILNKETIKKEELENYEENWRKIEAGGDVDSTDSDDASTSEDDETLWNDMRETIESKTKRKHKEALFCEGEGVLMKKGKLEDRNKRKHEEEEDSKQGQYSIKKSKVIESGKRKHTEEDDSTIVEKMKKRKFIRMKRCADAPDGSELLSKRFHSVTELNV